MSHEYEAYQKAIEQHNSKGSGGVYYRQHIFLNRIFGSISNDILNSLSSKMST